MVSNKWLITRDGAMLKSEISVVVPQLNQEKSWNIFVINKQGIQMPVFMGIDSNNHAIGIMDRIIHEIEKTEEDEIIPEETETTTEESVEETKEI